MDLLMKPLYNIPRAETDVDGDLDCLEDDENLSVDKQYQHENIYNKFLPYDISAECREHLMRIKLSLAQCVELDQETVYEWFMELERFVDVYGLAFTKEEHIYLIKIQYELIVSRNSMDLYYISYVASCFSRLMRKRYLISSEELQLDWRPLYETYERLFFSETESAGLRFIPENLESNLSQAIKLARLHFPLEATQEMLDEWRPNINRYGFRLQKAIIYMNLFLPTTLPPEHHDRGFKLWFDEVMQFWLNQKIYVSGSESKFTLLLSRLSSDCLGFIDWEPYIPKIFNQFKACLKLNGIYGKSKMRFKNDTSDIGPMVQWMVYMINRSNSCLDHISKLFKGIESFYHPSNVDRRWHSKLQSFLHKLPACYVKRLYRERIKKNIWSKRVPESHRLTEEQTTKFVDALMPVVLTSMFNQGAMSSAAATFRDLSALRPEKVIPPLLERLYGSYDTLIEPYRLVSSINCMASVVPAMVRPSKFFPEGPSHVVPLLFNSLPGIDSNDMRKCITVFRFIATLASHVQIKDYSYLVDERQDLTPEQQQLCLSTGQFEDFVIQFLDKCFVLIENAATITVSNADQETHFKNGEEGIIESAISSVTLSILSQASAEIQEAALDKIYSHVTRNIFDTKTQGRAIATLCLACAKATPKNTLKKFMPYFGKLLLTLTDNEEIFQDSTLDEELLFSLLLISEIVRCNSPHILDHKELIMKVLTRALNLNVKEAYMLGCSIIRHLLRALTNIACPDWRNIDDNEGGSRDKFWPFDKWGSTMHVKDLKPKWQLPGPESRQFAQELLEIFLKKAVEDLISWSKGEKQLTRAQVQRALHTILSCLVGASSVLSAIKSPVVNLCRYEVPIVQLCIKNTGTEPIDFVDGTSIRTWIVEHMRGILSFMNKCHQDDTTSLTLICEILSTCIVYFGYNKTELRLASQRIKSIKDGCQNKLLGSKRHLRYLLIERIVQQHRAMLFNKGDPTFTELHLDVFNSFFELSQSHYYEIRVLAQDTVYSMLSSFPFLETILVPMLVGELKKTQLEHNKFKGLLHLVLGRRAYSSIVIDPNWSSLRHLWPALVESPHSEKHSIVKLLDRICNLVQKGFDTFELRYNFPEKIKRLAAEVWSSSSVDLENYKRPSDELKDRVKLAVEQRNKQRIENYEQLVIKLVAHIDNHHLHWHRRIVAYNLFTHLIRDDHPLPLVALKLCLNCLISERLSIRSKAVQLVSAQLKVLKRKYIKRAIPMRHKESSGARIDDLEAKANRISINEVQLADEEGTDSKLESTEKLKLDRCNTLSNSNKWLQYNLNDVNIGKEEWSKLIFVDKPHIGFYDWPIELVVFEPHEKQPKLDRPIEELSVNERVIYERFHEPSFIEKLVEYLCFEDNRSGNDPVSRHIANMFKGLFRNYGLCMLEPFKKSVIDNSASTCEHKHKFVLEFIGGLIKGSQHFSYEMMQEVRQFVLSTLEKLPITKENLDDWTCMIIYVFSNRDARRFLWLLDFIVRGAIMEANSSSPTITPFIQASRLTLAHQALIQCEWRAVDHIFPFVIENLMPQNHLLSYANVRSCLASIYSLVYTYDDPTPLTRIPRTLDNGPKRLQFIEFLLPRLAILGEGRRTSGTTTKTPPTSSMDIDTPSIGCKLMDIEAGMAPPDKLTDVTMTTAAGTANLSQHQIADMFAKYKSSVTSISSSDLKALEEQLSAASGLPSDASSFVDSLRSALPQLGESVALRSAPSSNSLTNADDPNESQERKEAIKLMKLTALWIVYIVCRMKSPVTADFFRLLPLICEMGRKNSDPELEADSLGAMAILGGSSLRPEAIVESLHCVRRIIANNSWHARVAAAAFIEIMVSTNFFELLRNEDWRREIEDIVINYLVCDERIEVRSSSSLTLSGLIHCEFTKLTPELLAEFKQRANEPLLKKKQANGISVIDSKSITVRHSGILCLCACVEAHPYTVPEYLPEILCLLSDHLTDPQPISTTIKKTMSNFRRTHHDNWQSDKTKFTDDQLSVLANLLVSPSYYA